MLDLLVFCTRLISSNAIIAELNEGHHSNDIRRRTIMKMTGESLSSQYGNLIQYMVNL